MMSNARRQFAKALAKKGYSIKSCYWEPIGSCMEMCGPSGGWTLFLNEHSDVLLGYNKNEILDQIEQMSSYEENQTSIAE